ncbi:LuxR C-terminal-related transcriptional regulator [Mycobacterium sp. SMC-4]|uniref:LuxR C-terminal-related transcriptional regulator n=1 Tax=Mycobacterium sp. SMC-4 TaxID=2857059 RepID=UPI003CFEAFBD
MEAVVTRIGEERAVADLLQCALERPAALLLEGEAGIGKTTQWLSGLEQARRRGFEVFSARVGQAESMLAYAAVADLLSDIESDDYTALPEMQRLALDRVLFRAGNDGPPTDQWVVTAGLVTVMEAVAMRTPVLIALDDAQWLDPSSAAVLTFAVRRLRGRIGFLVTERCEPGAGTTQSWLQLGGRLTRIRLGPLPVGALRTLISDRLGRVPPAPSMARIAAVSAGNPLFALELARAMDERPHDTEPRLPGTLSDLVRLRTDGLDDDVREVLLAAASVAQPTVDLLARACGRTPDELAVRLASAQRDGVVHVEDGRVRFTHPLLAHGVYAEAAPARRRQMHRVLAGLEERPELQARHLALATTTADDATLAVLDAAAESARARGAPAAAAELAELAIGLGGDKPWRRVRAAGDHFQAGATTRALTLLQDTVGGLRPGMLRAIALNLLAGILMYANRFSEARDALKSAAEDAEAAPAVFVQTLMSLSFAQGMGSFAEGTSEVGLFDDSLRNARRAADIAEELGVPGVISKALALWVHANFLFGNGVDEDALRRALELEDYDDDVPIPFRASAVQALVRAWTGHLGDARRQMAAVRTRCLERGSERNMMAVASYGALIELWDGELATARALADEAVERAAQLGGDNVALIPLSVRASVLAHLGQVESARADAMTALEAARRAGSPRMEEWPIKTLGFLELSRGDPNAAYTRFAPLIERLQLLPEIEIMGAGYLPDAAEAMIAIGRLDEAEPLIKMLENNGRRLDRSWMVAASLRCRAMLLAAQGHLDAAQAAVDEALVHHERLPMPFERARTRLLAGQVQRRQRRKEAAVTLLDEARAEFDRMGAVLWVQRAHAELARDAGPGGHTLTPAEQRVAELAAAGTPNKEIAAKLFISAKTVEHHLGRVYRKLGIRSRVELGRRLDELDTAR